MKLNIRIVLGAVSCSLMLGCASAPKTASQDHSSATKATAAGGRQRSAPQANSKDPRPSTQAPATRDNVPIAPKAASNFPLRAGDMAALVRLARLSYERGDYELAKATLLTVLDEEPNHLEAAYYLRLVEESEAASQQNGIIFPTIPPQSRKR